MPIDLADRKTKPVPKVEALPPQVAPAAYVLIPL